MLLSNLLKKSLETATLECWERERAATLTRRSASRSHTRNRRFLGTLTNRGAIRSPTRSQGLLVTPVRAFAVRLQATGCSLRGTKAILALLGVKRSHQSIFQWVHRVSDSVSDPPSASLTRVAVNKTAIKINGEWSCVYAAIDTGTKLLLGIDVFDRHGTDQAATFLSGVAEKHELSDAVFLVDGSGYRTALFRIGLSGRLDYIERNLIDKWFHTLKQRIDRFHTSWVGSRPSVQQCLERFVH
jgi:putative transposase